MYAQIVLEVSCKDRGGDCVCGGVPYQIPACFHCYLLCACIVCIIDCLFALLMAATGLIAALPAVLYEVLPAVNWATVGSSPGLTVAMSVAGILVIGIPIIGLIHMLMRHFGGWQPMSIVTKLYLSYCGSSLWEWVFSLY